MKTILVVDADAEMRSKCETEIASMGHLPVSAKNGQEAITAFADVHPDLVIIELELPDLHGFEVIRKILFFSPDTRVIIHSSYSHYRTDFMAWAAEEYIVKSGDMHELRNAIRRILHLHSISVHLD